MTAAPPLLLVAPVHAMDGDAVSAGAVACRAGRVIAVGTPAACEAALPPAHRRIELPGAVILPGFIDAHVHVFAAAAARSGVDCSPRAVPDIAGLLRVIGEAAAAAPPGQWVRATGYEETMLAEGRPPTRAELDGAAPDHPVRLIHRTGHAEVLNTRGLATVGIDEHTPEPSGAAFGRSLDDGRLDGLLIGMADAIERAMLPADPDRVAREVRGWAQAQAAAGVTALVDAGARNDRARWDTLERLIAGGAVPQRVSCMEALDALGAVSALPASGAGGRLSRGESKVMLRALEHALSAGADSLAQCIAPAIAAARRIAIHATTPRAVEVALDALEAVGAPPGQRIEHAPLLPEPLLERVATGGVHVVAQPALLREVAARYERLIDAASRPALHPWRRLLDAGGALAFSSDAPVSSGSPLAAVAAASSLRPAGLAPEQALTPAEALAAWTGGAARAAHFPDRGRIAVGLPADLVALSGPLFERPQAAQVRLTVIDGVVVYDAAGPAEAGRVAAPD